jgi:hypothetical protein
MIICVGIGGATVFGAAVTKVGVTASVGMIIGEGVIKFSGVRAKISPAESVRVGLAGNSVCVSVGSTGAGVCDGNARFSSMGANVAEGVTDGNGVFVRVWVAVFVTDGMSVAVGPIVGNGVTDGSCVALGVTVGVSLGTCVKVIEAVGVSLGGKVPVADAVLVAVSLGVIVSVGTSVTVAVSDGMGDGDSVTVNVGDGIMVARRVGIIEGNITTSVGDISVTVGVNVGAIVGVMSILGRMSEHPLTMKPIIPVNMICRSHFITAAPENTHLTQFDYNLRDRVLSRALPTITGRFANEKRTNHSDLPASCNHF